MKTTITVLVIVAIIVIIATVWLILIWKRVLLFEIYMNKDISKEYIPIKNLQYPSYLPQHRLFMEDIILPKEYSPSFLPNEVQTSREWIIAAITYERGNAIDKSVLNRIFQLWQEKNEWIAINIRLIFRKIYGHIPKTNTHSFLHNYQIMKDVSELLNSIYRLEFYEYLNSEISNGGEVFIYPTYHLLKPIERFVKTNQ